MMQKAITGRDLSAVTVDVSLSIDVDFVLFFNESHRPMLRLAFLLTGSVTHAEEAVQECFVKVLESWTRIEDPTPTCVELLLTDVRPGTGTAR